MSAPNPSPQIEDTPVLAQHGERGLREQQCATRFELIGAHDKNASAENRNHIKTISRQLGTELPTIPVEAAIVFGAD